MNNILNYFSKTHTPYLHAYTKKGTELLIEELNLNKNDTILEFGFGSGATLVKIKSIYPSITIYGLDISEMMLKKATSRLKFCGLYKNIELNQISMPFKFPYSNNFFDKIYIESVLGIVDEQYLNTILIELFRVLKPQGKLVFNETVWLPEITLTEMEKINIACKNAFGIKQAQICYPYSLDWEKALKNIGFTNVKVSPFILNNANSSTNRYEFLSKIYTYLGKINKINPKLIREMREYKKNMKSIYENKKYMEGYLFSSSK